MKQTAVEWLEDNLLSEPWTEEHFKYNAECWDKAKEMERETNIITWESPIRVGRFKFKNNKEMKQTAVEWLVEQICGDHTEQWQKEIEQAKAMEKEQIVNAYNDCEWTGDHEDGEQYYNETYESNTRI